MYSRPNCLRKLKIKILYLGNKTYKIFGRGLGSYTPKKSLELNFGNSGTLARLIIGILTSTPNIDLKIFGDKSLNKRSMKKLILLMNKFGADFFPRNKFFFPLRFSSSNYPIGISYKSDTSAQLKRQYFAGLNSYGNTEIIENLKSKGPHRKYVKKINGVCKLVMVIQKK